MFSILPVSDINPHYLAYFGFGSVIVAILLVLLVVFGKLYVHTFIILFSLIPVFLLLVLVASNNSIYLKSDKGIEADDLDNAYSELIKPIVKDYTKDTRPSIIVGVSGLSQNNKKSEIGVWNDSNSVSDITYLIVRYPKINNESRTNETYSVSDGKLKEPSEFKSSDIRGKVLTEKMFLGNSLFHFKDMVGVATSYFWYYSLVIIYIIISVLCYKALFKRGKTSKKGSVTKL